MRHPSQVFGNGIPMIAKLAQLDPELHSFRLEVRGFLMDIWITILLYWLAPSELEILSAIHSQDVTRFVHYFVHPS